MMTDHVLEGTAPGVGESPIKKVLRSKGFMWLQYQLMNLISMKRH